MALQLAFIQVAGRGVQGRVRQLQSLQPRQLLARLRSEALGEMPEMPEMPGVKWNQPEPTNQWELQDPKTEVPTI